MSVEIDVQETTTTVVSETTTEVRSVAEELTKDNFELLFGSRLPSMGVSDNDTKE